MAINTRSEQKARRQSTLNGSCWETGMGGPQGSIAGGELCVMQASKTKGL